ncbi:hypothetical protein WPG_0632 [Winogradskyella sp. PG-2]|nr:hypothetical protein WPG_0632 [Winogradskyella sp. PG-2]
MLNSKHFIFLILSLFCTYGILGQTKLNKGNVENRENPFANDSSAVKKIKRF